MADDSAAVPNGSANSSQNPGTDVDRQRSLVSRGAPRVKNKAPAPIQISAEQLLREALERQEPAISEQKQPTTITDVEELLEYQGRKRRDFENQIRRNRLSIPIWIKYANFELEQEQFARARSVFERALDVDPNNVPLWLKYIDSELKYKNINHARNLFDRAVTILPRVDKFWYKYIFMEEALGNVTGTRQIFERWMEWQPDTNAWLVYTQFEKRHGNVDRARAIFERFTIVHPEPPNWIKWARFEEDNNELDLARQVFNLALETLGENFMDERIFIEFAKFETRLKEYERARVIFKYALDRLPRSKSLRLYREYTLFEKQYGDKEGIEDAIITKRRVEYENLLKENPGNYELFFDLARLEESAGDVDKIRDVYERAIAQVPPSQEKRHWRRYIYFWIFYALFEENVTKDYERSRQIYKECLKIVPHKKFTFAKVWLLYADFNLRRMDLKTARKALGQSIGMCPKNKLFRGYIKFEDDIKEFDRCRIIFEKWIEYDPLSPTPWIEYGKLERKLGDIERARSIYEIAIEQQMLEMPELVWKAYIDFEFEEDEYERARALYERLLARTNHVKVWVSFADFEISHLDDEDEDPPDEDHASPTAIRRARGIFERAMIRLREMNAKEERIVLLEAWEQFESIHGTREDIAKVEKSKPRSVKKRRKLEDGSFEEYIDYIFPDDEDERTGKMAKMLEMAQQWKKKIAEKTLENASVS